MSMTTPPGAPAYDDALLAKLAAALAAKGPDYVPRTHHMAGRAPKYTNRLVLETSPYLLQHAHNPVDWRPWGDEAFAEAARLGRPVFLSVGYSTCHWCHVMEGESFEDEEIARFMNEHYVCIKVDREERPDVDAVYMSAVQALTQSGGWPMSVWLTPAREPFFGGTYFPPRDGARGARHGFLTILRELADTYAKDGDRVGRAAKSLVEAVRKDMAPADGAGAATPGAAVIAETIGYFKRAFDTVEGGVRRAPKFPSNVPIRLLLRAYRRTGDADTLHMAELTLEKMAGGGMYDQLGGGFHRYSTDARWLVPHFEKMLYDNALLAVAYAEAAQVEAQAASGAPPPADPGPPRAASPRHASLARMFARVARETCDYVLREMTSPEGAFYSATDADSEGEEGKFFVWSEREIVEILGDRAEAGSAGRSEHGGHGEPPRVPDLTARFLRYYGVTPGGNFEGANILNAARPDEQEHAALASARAQLYEARKARVPPLRDDKILAAWNGLMISGLAVAGRVLDEPRYVAAAARAADFALAHLRRGGEKGGRLLRSFKDGRPGPAGFLDDYAFLVAGLLDLYEAGFAPRFLEAALALADEQERLFADAERGGWFMTAGDHEALLAREKPAYDGAEPSGTSVALSNALRLAAFTTDDRWRALAERGFASVALVLASRPMAMTEALLALDWATDRPRELAIVLPRGAPLASAAPFLEALRARFSPNLVRAVVAEDEVAALAKLAPFVEGKLATAGKATAYVCERGACQLPTHAAADVAAELAKIQPY